MSIRSHLSILIVFCLALIFSTHKLHGQSVKVNAPSQVEVGQKFTITYQIVGGNGDATISSAPELGALQLLYGPAFAREVEVLYVNGRVTPSSSYNITYTVLATEPGTYKVTGPTISISGKTLKGSTSNIKITPATQRSSNPQQLAGMGERGHQAIFNFVAIPERTTVYEQEPLLVTYRTRGTQPYRIINHAPASHKGFVSQDIQESNQIPFFSERINGTNYISLNLISEVLYPIAAGEQSISSAAAVISYIAADEASVFLNQDKKEELLSQEVKINVKPIPVEGRPETFSGAVGQFSIRYELDKQPWRTNEASSLKIIISGTGNLKPAKSPAITLPDALELYDPIESNDQVYSNGQINATRTIEYSLIPRKTGRVQLPTLTLSYFDPKSGSYRTATAQAQTVEVVQGRNIEHQQGGAVLQHATSGQDVPYDIIQEGTTPSAHPQSGLGIVSYLVVNILIVVLGFGLYRYLAYRRAQRSDTTSYKATRAGKIASKRLSIARQKLNENAIDAFYGELLKAIWGYLGDKLKLPQSALNRSDIAIALQDRGVSNEVITELTSIIDTIEYARYAPTNTPQGLQELYSRSAHLIEEIESRR